MSDIDVESIVFKFPKMISYSQFHLSRLLWVGWEGLLYEIIENDQNYCLIFSFQRDEQQQFLKFVYCTYTFQYL